VLFETVADGGICLIIHGGASGADRLAGHWAVDVKIPCMVFPAPWDSCGRLAGPLRNQWMLDFGKPDIVIAFPGGRGTANMVSLARQRNIEVQEIIE
jgi:hypothetical protein